MVFENNPHFNPIQRHNTKLDEIKIQGKGQKKPLKIKHFRT